MVRMAHSGIVALALITVSLFIGMVGYHIDIRDKVMKWIPKLKKDAQIVCANGICTVTDH